MNRRRLPPHLNVRSDSLVYLSGVPPNISGKEIKRRLVEQFGPIRFVETFEAWNGTLTGNMIIEFGNNVDSERFMSGVINGNVPYLKTVGVQHVGIVGPRHFFELVHRNTAIDLLYNDGKPFTMDWARNRQNREPPKSYTRPKPYTRRPPYSNSSENKVNSGVNTSTANNSNSRDRHSSSSEEDIGPFPSSSNRQR